MTMQVIKLASCLDIGLKKHTALGKHMGEFFCLSMEHTATVVYPTGKPLQLVSADNSAEAKEPLHPRRSSSVITGLLGLIHEREGKSLPNPNKFPHGTLPL